MRKFYFVLLFICSTTFLFSQSTASFEELELPLDTFLNNAEETGGYQSGNAFFPNNYSPDFGGFWAGGWALSTMRDDSTSGFGNLYSAISGSGSESSTYTVGQQNATISIQNESMGKLINGLYLTNTTYAHNSMRDGDDFAKKFGGESGTDPDFFKLEIKGFFDGQLSTNTIEFYLADFRFEEDSLDYIVSDWQWVDLSNLGNVDSLQFTLVSTDIGDFGINTPLFFCMDNLEMSNFKIDIPTDENISTFEESNISTNTFLNGSEGTTGYQSGNSFYPNGYSPDFGGFWASGWAISAMRDSVTSGFGNLYSAKTAAGATSLTYAVGQQNAQIKLIESTAGKIVKGLYITNGTYAHNSMRDGDDFAKKFGGESGDDPDFFKLEIQKYSNGVLAPQIVEFYLADFRFEDNSQDYIVSDWQWVDLTSLGNVDSLRFTLSSSDIGSYGINTPLFFCIDNLEVSEDISTSNKEELLAVEKLSFYPNPAINEIIINLPTGLSSGEIQVFDLLGRSLIQQSFSNNHQTSINVSSLKTGTYILQIVTEDGKGFSNSFLKY